MRPQGSVLLWPCPPPSTTSENHRGHLVCSAMSLTSSSIWKAWVFSFHKKEKVLESVAVIIPGDCPAKRVRAGAPVPIPQRRKLSPHEGGGLPEVTGSQHVHTQPTGQLKAWSEHHTQS